MSLYVTPGISYDPNAGSGLKRAGQAVGSFFKNLFNSPPPQQYNSPFVPAANIPTSYQVKDNDTDIISVANNLGVPPQQLIEANNGTRTLPPTGSFISTTGKANISQIQANQYVGQGVSVPSGGAATVHQPPSTIGGGATSFQSGNSVNLAETQFFITQQLSNGILPTAIPFGTVPTNPATGQPFTAAEMQASGYVFNQNNRTYELGGTGGPQRTTASGGAWNPATAQTDIYGGQFVQAGATRWGRDERGRLVRQVAQGGRWRNVSRRRERERAAPQEAANAAATPTQTLALVLGSG